MFFYFISLHILNLYYTNNDVNTVSYFCIYLSFRICLHLFNCDIMSSYNYPRNFICQAKSEWLRKLLQTSIKTLLLCKASTDFMRMETMAYHYFNSTTQALYSLFCSWQFWTMIMIIMTVIRWWYDWDWYELRKVLPWGTNEASKRILLLISCV